MGYTPESENHTEADMYFDSPDVYLAMGMPAQIYMCIDCMAAFLDQVGTGMIIPM